MARQFATSILLPGAPTATNEAATKGYADGKRPYLPGPAQSASYFFPVNPGLISTDSFPAGNLYVVPWLCQQSMTIARIGVDVTATAAAGTVARPGIYADNGAGYPGALVLDAGTVPATAISMQDATVSVALTPGLYWIGMAGQVNAVGIRSAYGYEPVVPLSAGTTQPSAGTTPLSYFQTGVTGALPATFSTSVQSNFRMPRIHMRTA